MTVPFPDHPFWDFSLEVYLTEGVPAACVVLQDRHDIDVNVLLFCCWLGASGRGALSAAEMRAVTGAVAEWNRDIVCALRAVRRKLKGGLPPAPESLSEPLRAGLQTIEVDFEHVEQLMLAGAVDRAADENVTPEQRAADGIANIAAYLKWIGIGLDSADIENLLVPLRIAFPDAAESRLLALCEPLKQT